MWTGRYDRLRTRTLLFKISLTPFPTCYTVGPRKSIFPCATGRLRGPRPAENRAPGGSRLVQAPHASGVRRVPDAFWLLACLPRDRSHGGDELIQGFAGFGFGRLDHHRTLDDQRKVDRGRVEAVVEQPLGNVPVSYTH